MTERVIYTKIVTLVADELAENGYHRRGENLRLIRDGNVCVVNFQKSRDRIEGAIKFTMNVGVVLEALALDDRFDPNAASIIDAHVKRRLGYYTEQKKDVWWLATAASNAEAMAGMLIDLLDYALLEMESYLDERAVISLWESGQAPGLTDTQMQRNLRVLKFASSD